MELELDLGSQDKTLGALLARYTSLNMLAAPTRARYALVARNLARYMGGAAAMPTDILLDCITPGALLGFRTWSLERMRGVSFNTERRHLSALFNMAVRDGAMRANPFRSVPGAPVVKPLPRALAKEVMCSYMDFLRTSSQQDRHGRKVDLFQPQWFWLSVMRTFYYTGMRKRQLLELRWRDVDFSGRTIRLSAASSKTRREWLIPLPDALAPDLLELRTKTLQFCRDTMQDRQVFCLPLFSERRRTFKHAQMRPDNVDNFFQRLRKAMPADMPRISAHRIRHTTATILANAVPNLKVVQEQLGHASITTTYIYVHPDIGSMRRALEAL